MTDETLKLQLAKMLPDKIILYASTDPCWKQSYEGTIACGEDIKGTEWLHVCWIVEQTLSMQLPPPPHKESERTRYVDLLNEACGSKGCCIASWQQRAEALCKVKGITP